MRVRREGAGAASSRLSAFLLLIGVGATTPDPGPVREVRVEIPGATIRALCTDGPREVVLLHGGSSSADTWRSVLEHLDDGIGACAYDRRGSGQSGPASAPRGWFELLDEMTTIHAALGVEPTYVVVGHSLGGLYARLFAMDRAEPLSGLLLVDPAHEDMLQRLRPGMPAEEWQRRSQALRRPNEDGIIESRLARRLRGRRLPDVPVTVITATRRRVGDGWDPRFLSEGARRVHESILRGVTVARHLPAARSGHDVQRDEPELVAAEIRRLVRIARRDRR